MLKPQPPATPETREYWAACSRGELLYQVCEHCSHVQFYPRAHCTRCAGRQLAWKQSSGRGVIYSHTTTYRASLPAFADAVPYVLVLADMEEGFRIMLNIVDAELARVAIGGALRVVFRAETGGALLPQGELA